MPAVALALAQIAFAIVGVTSSDALVETIRKSVKKGDTVKIPDLGGWRMRQMKARMGRNPQTGEAIKIPARKKVGYTVAKSFKQHVLGTKK